MPPPKKYSLPYTTTPVCQTPAGAGIRVQGTGFRVHGTGFRVLGLGGREVAGEQSFLSVHLRAATR